jgi:hypothetical protein
MGVLIIGDPSDSHVSRVRTLLDKLGCQNWALNRLSTDNEITIRVSSDEVSGDFRIGNQTIDFGDVSAIWWRLKPVYFPAYSSDEERFRSEFRQEEWRALLYGLPSFLGDRLWINSVNAQRIAANKPTQLVLAVQHGFAIPPTALTNSPHSVSCFTEKHGATIFKCFSGLSFPPDEVIFTNLLRQEEVDADPDSVRQAPIIFQSRISKAFELRIAIVGKTLFAAKINSQVQRVTEVDWRRAQLEPMYEAYELPTEFAARLLAWHEAAGLHYGAYDFIVSDDGSHVFLECNPGGQWLWIEDAIGLPITRAMANDLAAA